MRKPVAGSAPGPPGRRLDHLYARLGPGITLCQFRCARAIGRAARPDNNAVQVMFGSGSSGVMASPLYSGLAPTFAGLYQINVLLPQSTPTGNVPVTISLPGHLSNVVDMVIATQ